jgi:hypothetical protein
MVSTLHRWFAFCRDSLRVAFECDPFHTKVIQSRGKPFLKLPTVDEEPGRPDGPVLVRLPDGREWEFRFVKIACNVAGPRGSNPGDTLPNELPTLLREWFGPDAGLPGTSFEVEFHRDGDAWHIAPINAPSQTWRQACSLPNPPSTRSDSVPEAYASGVRMRDKTPGDLPLPLLSSPPPTSRHTTHVPVYELTAAAGFWGPESQPEEIGWTEVPGVAVKPGMFVARVTGTSMEPLIPDGSWCLFRPCPAGSREGRIVLVQFAVTRRGRERRPIHRQEGALGAIYRFAGHRRRLAARFDSAPAGESGVRADHARAGGRGGLDDRWRIPITHRFSGRLST